MKNKKCSGGIGRRKIQIHMVLTVNGLIDV